jgi:hypothetical protein
MQPASDFACCNRPDHHILSPWSWAPLEKPSVVQLLTNFPRTNGTRRFITVLTRALHCSPSWARSVQSIPSHPIYHKSYWLTEQCSSRDVVGSPDRPGIFIFCKETIYSYDIHRNTPHILSQFNSIWSVALFHGIKLDFINSLFMVYLTNMFMYECIATNDKMNSE